MRNPPGSPRVRPLRLTGSGQGPERPPRAARQRPPDDPEDPVTDSLTRPDATEALTAALRERILVMDGAMGTMIQRYGLSEADFRGERFADWQQDVRGNSARLRAQRRVRPARP
jgi:hypothetical protein